MTKPSTEFYTNKTAADMLHSLCKQCHGDKCRSRASGNYDVSVVDKVAFQSLLSRHQTLKSIHLQLLCLLTYTSVFLRKPLQIFRLRTDRAVSSAFWPPCMLLLHLHGNELWS